MSYSWIPPIKNRTQSDVQFADINRDNPNENIGARDYRFLISNSLNFDVKHLNSPNIISYHSYGINKGIADCEFISAIEKVNHEFASKQKGWLSSLAFNDGSTWADIVIMESKESLEQFVTACNKSEVAHECGKYMDVRNLKSHLFTIEQSYCC